MMRFKIDTAHAFVDFAKSRGLSTGLRATGYDLRIVDQNPWKVNA